MKRLLVAILWALIIFQSEQAAQDFAAYVHGYLQANRPLYNAIMWAEPIKHQTENKWAVGLPPESVQVPEGTETVEALSPDWFPEDIR